MNIPEMTGRERVMAALEGKPFDVYPAASITSIATIDAMERGRAFLPEAHTDGVKMADLAAVAHDFYGFDSVAPYFSIHLEAASLGCPVNWADRFSIPYVTKPPLHSLDEIDIPKDIMNRPLLRQLLKACKILKKRYDGTVAVIGKVVGPWTMAFHLRGVENLLIDAILEPAKTRNALEMLSNVSMQFAMAQFEAGADACVWADHVTSDLVSAQVYRDIVYPVHCKAAKALEPYGPLILHVCGNVEDRFDLFAKAGFSCFHMDSRNEIAAIAQAAKNRIQLAGCINNPFTLSTGTAERVHAEVDYNIQCGISLISPECAIPTSVTAENLRELARAAHSHRYLSPI